MYKDELIRKLREKSIERRNELILEMLEMYNVFGTRDLSCDQVERFCKFKGVI